MNSFSHLTTPPRVMTFRVPLHFVSCGSNSSFVNTYAPNGSHSPIGTQISDLFVSDITPSVQIAVPKVIARTPIQTTRFLCFSSYSFSLTCRALITLCNCGNIVIFNKELNTRGKICLL